MGSLLIALMLSSAAVERNDLASYEGAAFNESERPSPWGVHWRCWPVGLGVVGGLLGGTASVAAFWGGVSALAQADNCAARGEECEGYALTIVFYTIPVGAMGMAAGTIGGVLVGLAIGLPAEQ